MSAADDAATARLSKVPNTVRGFAIPVAVISDTLNPAAAAAAGFPSMHQLMTAHREPDPLQSLTPLVTDWVGRAGPGHCRYLQLETGVIRSTLHRSIVPRDGKLDIIVSTVEACVERAGHGTAFMLALHEVARTLSPPRGVELQQLITPASRGLAARLCATHGWSWSSDRMSVYSPP
jgi:hypothetical protein